MNGGDVLAAAVAETLGPGLNDANAERFVSVGFKGIARNMRMVQHDTRHLRQVAKARAVFLVAELFRYTLHVKLPLGLLFIIRDDPWGRYPL